MVLPLKRWKSRSSPGIEAGGCAETKPIHDASGRPFWRLWRKLLMPAKMITRGGAARQPICHANRTNKGLLGCHAQLGNGDAGWSSPVARQAHNLKVVGSNPTPATKNSKRNQSIARVMNSSASRLSGY